MQKNLKAETGTGLVSQLDTVVLTPFEQQDQTNAERSFCKIKSHFKLFHLSVYLSFYCGLKVN